MKYIVEFLFQEIVQQQPQLGGKAVIRIDGFEDIRIYESLCSKLKEYFSNGKTTLLAKLSLGKYEEFKNKKLDIYQSSLQSMEKNKWIDYVDHLTNYRNLLPKPDEQLIILLLGTEAVQDRGGLEDFFALNPNRLENIIKGKYHKFFRQVEWTKDEETCIDKLYGDLFELVPVNLYRLSCIADEWTDIDGIDMLVSQFFRTLPRWDMPKMEADIHSAARILRNSKNVLAPIYQFIERNAYKDLTKNQYSKIKKQLEKYSEDESRYADNWEGWENQSIKSYDEFKYILDEFVLGKNIKKNRELLLNTDYAVSADVLGLKLKKDGTLSSPKIEKVYGMPLTAMLQSMLVTFAEWNPVEHAEVKNIIFSFERVGLIDALNPLDDNSNSEQLAMRWAEICLFAGGVIDYIGAQRTWELGSNELNISCEPVNFFSPQHAITHMDNQIVHALGSNQRLNKVKFSIFLRKADGKESKKKEFEWYFENNEDWLSSFADISGEFSNILTSDKTSFIPFGTLADIKQLAFAKSGEEFFDALECANINYHDVVQWTNDKAESTSQNEWGAEISDLGRTFVEYCCSVKNKGFFGDIGDFFNSKLQKTVNSYIELGRKMTQNALPENAQWVLKAFIHSFCIEGNNRSLINDEESSCCIVPPWHPAVLEKLKDRMVFILDGCEQWWKKNHQAEGQITKVGIENLLEQLEQLSWIHEAVDVFPGKGKQSFGSLRAFGGYCVYGNMSELTVGYMRTRDALKKEAIFDDDFKDREFTKVDAEAKLIYDVIDDYAKVFPQVADCLSLAFIEPNQLQPIVAALHKFIVEQKKMKAKKDFLQKKITMKINILLSPENKGGRNYLSYWVDSFFSEDENIDIKIYINEWTSNQDIQKSLDDTLDVVFLMDVLLVDNLSFIPMEAKTNEVSGKVSECLYPMVFKPSPASRTSVKRKIEITQTQFQAATVHSQAVYYHLHPNFDHNKQQLVVKEVCINGERQELIYLLHQKAYWVICVDGGMDGALLKSDTKNGDKYNIIGFSTGKGPHGQYNVTITARAAIIDEVRKRFENRLRQLFGWECSQIAAATSFCLDQASKLDGISLLEALNPDAFQINEFMAYVLTSTSLRNLQSTHSLQVLIHLDSYKHWFNKNINGADTSKRPDFLHLTAETGHDGVVNINATVIECKIARTTNADGHKNKAIEQTIHGIAILQELFNPASISISRRYWYAQLYRALAFSQITFQDDSPEYSKLAFQLREILDGNFTISWNGKAMLYLVDMVGNDIVTEKVVNTEEIEVCIVPQVKIQQLLLGNMDDGRVKYINVVGPVSTEDNDQEKENFGPEEMEEDDDYIPLVRMKLQSKATYGQSVPYNEDGSDTVFTFVKDTVSVESSYTGQVEEDSKANVDENIVEVVQEQENKRSEVVTSPSKSVLEDVRIFVGTDKAGNQVYWDYGHKQLSNRHLLITGRSGQGKTYAIQAMLQELSLQGISSVVFDYTEGFRQDQLEEAFLERLGDKIKQRVVYVQGIAINPFRRQEFEIDGMILTEKVVGVAQRVANIFSHVYGFGEQQKSAVYEACRNGMEKHGVNMNFSMMREELMSVNTSFSKSALSKMAPFLDSDIFDVTGSFDWDQVTRSDGTVTIFQLTSFVRDIQVIITEMMLWDAWHYNRKYGNKKIPFVVVLDEAQNLSHKADSPSAMILTEGRKFGWSAWFATQFLKAQLSDDEINRLQQAAVRIYFKPSDDEISSIAKQLDPSAGSNNIWINSLKNLQKGQCIVAGERMKTGGVFGPATPVVTKVASFNERDYIE